MDNCIQNTLKCLSGGLGVFTNIPTTTTTTIDPLCYLVDCKGNFIVDCQCDYIGCMCPSSPILTTTTSSTTTTIAATTTTSSTTTSGGGGSTTTSSSTTIAPGGLLTVPMGANLVSFGDSITTPNYVPGGEPYLYTSLLASDLGVTSTRYALGGSGFKTLMKNVNGNVVPNTNIVTELTGLNNVYNEANKTNRLPIVSHGCYTLMANQWASSIVNGANSSINRVGVFTGYAAAREAIASPGSNAFGGKFGKLNGQALPNVTDAVYTSNVGAYAEYTATFKYAIVSLVGGTGVYSSYNSTTIPSGVARVYVDNVLHSTINLSQQYPVWAIPQDGFGPDVESMGPVLVPIIMPNSASRTIKIELVSGDMAIDYIAILNNPASCYPVILGEIPYVNPDAITYPPGWGPYGASPAVADTYSGVKQSIVNTWAAEGFPIRYCVINSPAGPYSYVNTTDGTHPNQLGNQQVKTAFRLLFV